MSEINEKSEDGITVFDIPANTHCGISGCWVCTNWKKGDANDELHRAEYGYTKKSETKSETQPKWDASAYVARTQKALGVQVLSAYTSEVPAHVVLPLPLPREALTLDSLGKLIIFKSILKYGGKVFARPCPMTPRHGFVDSRIIEDLTDLQALADETLAADSQGELLLMEAIPATASAVLTPTAIAIGSSTDGATQGRNAVTLPLVHAGFSDASLIERAHINDTPYVEALYHLHVDSEAAYSPRIVQLRDGVATGQARLKPGENWVYTETVVTGYLNVADYGDDALGFEADVKAAIPGTVLIHKGGTLLSHFSQHAMLRKMPIIFGTIPEVGTTLTPTVSADGTPQIAQLKRGLVDGMYIKLDYDTYRQAATFALVALHNASALMYDEMGAYYLGAALIMLTRLAYAAISGEFRHHQKRGGKKCRDTVYTATLNGFEGFLNGRKTLPRAWRSFAFAHWTSGYGGAAWAKCSTVTAALDTTLRDFVKHSRPETLAEIISAAHNVINCAHNNGRFLSKYVSQSVFDAAARGNVVVTLTGLFFGYYRLSLGAAMPDSEMYAATVNVWKKLKTLKEPVEPKANKKKAPNFLGVKGKIQFHMDRDQGRIIHFQQANSGHADGYVSANIYVSTLPQVVTRWLSVMCATKPKNAPSMAGNSDKRYWILSPYADVPSELQAVLAKNFIYGPTKGNE